MFGKTKRIHFIGIGGIGMSAIAEVLHNRGFVISGSDSQLNDVTDHLSQLGINVFEGHSADNICNADVVVYSSAVHQDNPEIAAAKEKDIPVIKRSDMLAECMRLQYGIGIAGTHGKTTTTAMTGLILADGNLDPSIIVGGKIAALGNTNARLGKGEFIVVEADEYDRTFLKLNPVITALTALEAEHLDTYKDIDDIKASFIEYANKIPFFGFAAVCIDDQNLREILPFINKKVITYGLSEDANVQAMDIMHNGFTSSYKVKYFNMVYGEIKLNIPGEHNIRNSLAAVIVALELGIDFSVIRKTLEAFKGAVRRFEVKYDKEIMVVDDYAHHPGEVSATLAGIRKGWNRRVIAVFQPHLYSRTKDFALEFGKAFLNSDIFICTDVYPARETLIPGISGELITDAAKLYGHKHTIYVKDKNELPEALMKIKKDNDIVITMGAGDIWKYGNELVKLVKGEISKAV